jgi:pimeloyl-ACP methyl ester carboxylesterase
MLNERQLHLHTDDGVRLSLWRLRDEAKNPPTGTRDIFLTHGTFSDRRICLGIAKHFASLGYTCWTLEWRGHGSSGASPVTYDFETVARHDVKAALEHLVSEEGIQGLHCVTHSGGGIVLTMCLARHPQFVPIVDKVALFACQALHAASSKPRGWLLRSMRLASRLWGSVPGRHLGLGVQNESFFMMKQWYDWNIRGSFSGRDGFDYWGGMQGLVMPVLSIVGAADKVIAPPASCEQYLKGFGGHRNQSMVCGLSTGFSKNYAHANVILSRAAMNEVWPFTANWLASNHARPPCLK